MLKNLIFALVAAATTVQTVAAQTTYKYGHMNLGNFVEQLPDVKVANDQLKVFAEGYGAKADSLAKAFQTDYEKVSKDYNAGLLTPVQAQQAQADLEKKQQFLQAFENDAQTKVTTKREELLKPILDKVEAAIKEIAKENGYAMIFDTSTGAALFAQDTEDVTPLVKKKMGVQ